MKTAGIPLLLALFFISCGEVKKDSSAFRGDFIIQEDSLIQIIKDIHLVDAAAKQNLIENNVSNYVKYKQYKAVFEMHHISKTRFDSTISLYTRNSEKFDELYDKVIQSLEEEEKANAAQ